MRRAARFLLVLLAGSGRLDFGRIRRASRTIRGWFESDLAMRSQAGRRRSAQRDLAHELARDDRQPLPRRSRDIARDERILGAAACSPRGRVARGDRGLSRSRFGCAWLSSACAGDGGTDAAVWSARRQSLPPARVQLSAVAPSRGCGPLGIVVLVHDLSLPRASRATARDFSSSPSSSLSLGGSSTLLARALCARRLDARAAARLFAGQRRRPEFQPLLRDVRDARRAPVTRERDGEARGGSLDPERLRATLTQYLHGERVVILANREPYIHERDGRRRSRVLHPASGLVTALEPVMRACSGVWVAHGSGIADRETVDASDRVRVPPGEESYSLRRVWLTEEEESGYYYGFSNEGLWPLCHVAHTRPIFRAEDWEHYVRVNQQVRRRRVRGGRLRRPDRARAGLPLRAGAAR